MAWRDLTDSPLSGDMLIVALEHKPRYNWHWNLEHKIFLLYRFLLVLLSADRNVSPTSIAATFIPYALASSAVQQPQIYYLRYTTPPISSWDRTQFTLRPTVIPITFIPPPFNDTISIQSVPSWWHNNRHHHTFRTTSSPWVSLPSTNKQRNQVQQQLKDGSMWTLYQTFHSMDLRNSWLVSQPAIRMSAHFVYGRNRPKKISPCGDLWSGR